MVILGQFQLRVLDRTVKVHVIPMISNLNQEANVHSTVSHIFVHDALVVVAAWADTLFMAAFFLLRMGVLLQDEALADHALNTQRLRQYTDEVRDTGAEPVLVTPLARNSWTGGGKYNDLLAEHAAAVLQLGQVAEIAQNVKM